MKKLFRAFLMCVSMFTVVPMPVKVWDEEARPLMTLWLPAVGLIIGGLWAFLAHIARISTLPKLVGAAVLCAYPFLITGGIHFDGYLDVTDAVKSYRDVDERRRIMKDPHVGSFAVLAGILLVVTQFALFASAKEGADIFTLMLIPAVSRTSAALAVTCLRPMTESEYSGAYRRGVKRTHAAVLSVLLAAELAAGFAVSGRGGFAGIAVILGFGHHVYRALRALGGMSGDVSGYALTFAETCGIAVFALI